MFKKPAPFLPSAPVFLIIFPFLSLSLSQEEEKKTTVGLQDIFTLFSQLSFILFLLFKKFYDGFHAF